MAARVYWLICAVFLIGYVLGLLDARPRVTITVAERRLAGHCQLTNYELLWYCVPGR